MKKFILCYELKNNKMCKFEFTLDVDFEKYNKHILKMYGKNIERRYVLDVHGNIMSLKRFKELYICK